MGIIIKISKIKIYNKFNVNKNKNAEKKNIFNFFHLVYNKQYKSSHPQFVSSNKKINKKSSHKQWTKQIQRNSQTTTQTTLHHMQQPLHHAVTRSSLKSRTTRTPIAQTSLPL